MSEALRRFIVKRDHKIEAYAPNKLAHSIYATCLSVRTPEGEAETTARKVLFSVEGWLSKKLEVTSADIRRKAGEYLVAYNPDAAYIYSKPKVKIKRVAKHGKK